MFDRDLIQSQRITTRVYADANQDIVQAMNNQQYQFVIQKCNQMPSSKQKFLMLSYAYMGSKQWKNIIDCCDQALQIDQKQPQFYSLKAKAMGKLGKNHDRLLLLKKAIQLDPYNSGYHRNLGNAYYSIQRYQLAIEQFNKAIQLNKQNVFNYHNKGLAHLKNDQLQNAKESFKKAVQINPNLALSYSWLADCEMLLKNFDQSQRLYMKAYQLSKKQIYLKQIQNVKKQRQLHANKGTLMYGLSWLKNKIF